MKQVSIGEALTILIICIYNFAVIFSTGFVVFEKGYSGWWFLLAFFCLTGIKNDDSEKECKCQKQ